MSKIPATGAKRQRTCAGSLLGLYADAVKRGGGEEGGLDETYEDAAREAADVCGSTYAQVGIAKASGTIGRVLDRRKVWGMAATAVLLTLLVL